MMHVKVLGTGCANCKNTVALVQAVASEKGVAVEVEKVEDLRDIMSYGIMSTPGVVIEFPPPSVAPVTPAPSPQAPFTPTPIAPSTPTTPAPGGDAFRTCPAGMAFC